MLAKNIWLIIHAAMLPKTLDFLQSDNVGITHSFGNASKIDLPVKPESETDVVCNELHLVLRRDVYWARQAHLRLSIVSPRRSMGSTLDCLGDASVGQGINYLTKSKGPLIFPTAMNL